MEFLKNFFSSGGFLPHGTCYLWNWRLILLHITSDSLIALAYMSIPITLVHFVRKRKDLPFNWMFLCFGTFIVACGLTHVMEVVVLWQPVYWLSGVVKVVTAAASVPTAILLVRLVPQALAFPSPTDLIRANEVLLASEQKFRSVVDTARDAIITADSLGNITDFNPAAEEIFLYSSSEVMGRPLTALMPERFREAHRSGLERFLKTGEARVIGKTVELVGRKKDGAEFPVELSLSSWKTREGIFFTGILSDITDRIKVQDDLRRRSEDLEGTNRELEAFTYSVSHDLRAPIRHIDGFSRILLDQHGGQLPPEGQRQLKRIREATRQMGDLVDDLLNLSRIGRQPLALQRTNLNTLVTNIKTDLSSELAERQVEWHIAALPTIECDPGLIKQVFFNLLANAVKFTRPKEGARIEVGLASDDGRPAIFIRDNGVGFNMKYADKLFGVFQRLHRLEDFEGTGVGLATVERIVRKHGGRIWAEAEPGSGATFYFTLPSLAPSHGKALEILGART